MRRSVRLSSVARSAGAQSIASVAATSTTPGRRRGPLPKVNPRQSTAYGASGRRGGAEELNVPVTGFAQAFDSQRGTSVIRNAEPSISGALNGGSAQPSPTPGSAAGSPSDDDQANDEGENEDDSVANTSKSFGMSREAGMLNTHTLPSYPSRVSVTQTQQVRQRTVIRDAAQTFDSRQIRPVPIPMPLQRPSRAPIPRVGEDDDDAEDDDIKSEGGRWPWQQYFMSALVALFALSLIMLASGRSSGSYAENSPKHGGMMNAIFSRISYAYNGVVGWVQPDPRAQNVEAFRKGDGTDEDRIWWARLMKFDEKWENRMKGMEQVIEKLRDDLPDHVVITRRRDGTFEIPDDFWKALLGKANGDPSVWKEFVQRNAVELKYLLEPVDITNGDSRPLFVSREDFLEMINKRHTELAERVDVNIAEALRSHTKQILSIAEKEARKVVVDQIRLQSLALTNIMANVELTQRKVNYYAPGFGAVVEPDLTSATLTENHAFLARMYSRIVLYSTRRPPTEALVSWEDPGECWCSAREKDGPGRTQLAIKLSTPMFPNQITIEHIPKAVAPRGDISDAPREVELWVQTSETPTFFISERAGQCSPGLADWKCLGKVKYDIHGANHIQTFNLDGQLSIPVSRTMVRVTSNWGADHTCIYRVRLHGRDDGPKHEYPAFH